LKKLDLVGKEKPELEKLLVKSKKDLFDLKMQNSMGKLKNSGGISEKRKEIARILTEIRGERVKV
jgi:ribosomal protein L29